MSKQDQGFVTFAQNTKDVDYLGLAYVQALNIKILHPDAKCAVIVDKQTLTVVNDKHKSVFDFIIELPYDENSAQSSWKLSNEYQVFNLTPFKETIKLESDLLFTRNIDHWWHAFRLRDVVLSHNCRNYRQKISNNRTYRKFFDDNELPDVYNGLMYFRYSKTSSEFFLTAMRIFQNWDYLKNHTLKNCREDVPSTDVLYALTAKVLGVENCTLPSLDFVNFVHMKNAVNGWGNSDSAWTDMVMHEFDLPMIRVNNLNQYHPIHYYDKNFINEDIINEFERTYYNSK